MSHPGSSDSLSDELLQATVAVTYYVATTSLIAAVQTFGIDQTGIGAEPTTVEQPEVLVASVTTSKNAVDQVAALLGQRALDASLPVWGAIVTVWLIRQTAGDQIALPRTRGNRPSREALEWHGDTTFLAG